MSASSSTDTMQPLVEQFCSVTGAEESVAKRMIEACNGNLEMAINMHVDDADNSQVIQNPHSSLQDPDDNVRPPIPQKTEILVDSSQTFGFRTRRRLPQSVFDGFRDFQAEAKWQEEMEKNKNDPSYKKMKTLEDLFRPPLDLIHKGSFESAREVGQITNQWLMVNIQNVQEFSCQVLNRDVWSNHAVKSIVGEHFVFWQTYNDSEEGQRYCQFYKVNEFPYIAVLDPRTGENLVAWNKMDPISFCDLITEFLSNSPSPNGTVMNIAHSNKKTRFGSIVDESEENQIRAAIEASIVEVKQSNSDDSPELTDIETFDSDSESIQEVKENHENHVQPENEEKVDADAWKKYLGADTDPKSKLMLRFPNGEKQQLDLPCTSQIQALILFASSQGYSNKEYELVTNFPRRNLRDVSPTSTLQESGLYPQETIFVQQNPT